MIFADKLIALRKQHGLSQEQLAEKLNVSRQSVSKWEGAQSIPDINKIIQLSQIFGVSTDYLLKDELENEKDEYIETGEKSEELKYVSMEDANEFLNITQSIATYISIGVLICILAPIPLIVFAVLSEAGTLSFSEEQTAMVGISVLLTMIAVAVALFIISGMKANKYEYLDTELMLVIRSREINRQLEEGMMTYEKMSRQVLEDGTYNNPYNVEPIALTKKKQIKILLVQHLLGWVRFLF